MTLRGELFAYVAENHPRSLRGIEEARAVDPARFDELSERFLGWLAGARGPDWLPTSADAYVRFSNDVILEQARYEARGRYASASFAEVEACVYSRREVMDDYLWGVFLTNFLWAHHMEIALFFRDRFVQRLPERPRLVEIAPGHGGWGVWALHERPDATLQGYDISPSSIAIAAAVSGAAGVDDRARYTRQDALDLAALPEGSADAVICSFLVEHLEEPARLFAVVAHLLVPGGRAFVTGALTAAQVDHIYEFQRESELVALCEQAGLRVLETLSVNPRRVLPRARHTPRSMALLVERRAQEAW